MDGVRPPGSDRRWQTHPRRGRRRISVVSFDIDSYRLAATPVAYRDLDYSAFASRPLSRGALRCLRW